MWVIERFTGRILYTYRVLLTGIHRMRTGETGANLVRRNAEPGLGPVDDGVARKLAGPEESTLDEADVAFHLREFERLVAELEAAHQPTSLPETPSARPALNDLLLRIRLESAGWSGLDRPCRAAIVGR